MTAPVVGSRWRHRSCSDTDRWDVIVLAVVENDGASFVVYGEATYPAGLMPHQPSVLQVEYFVSDFGAVEVAS